MTGPYTGPGPVWFEYHCTEAHDSADADLWYRSQQIVTIVRELGEDEVDEERRPMFEVAFADGFVGIADPDELLESPAHFVRPPPPPNAHTSTANSQDPA